MQKDLERDLSLHKIMSKQNNEALIRNLYEAWAAQNFKAYFGLLADDIVYHAAGNCPFSGVHRGKEAVIKMGQLAKELGGTHRVVLKQLMANESHIAVIDLLNFFYDGFLALHSTKNLRIVHM